MIDPLLEVTPTMALAETFTAFIVQPLEHLGRHIGKFFNALLQETSWLSSPVILTFVFIAILLCLVMSFNYRFRLPFFLGAFEPRTNHNDSFALELKEQQKIMLELKSTINAFRDGSAPNKNVPVTSLPDTSTRIEALQFDHIRQQSSMNMICISKDSADATDTGSGDEVVPVKRRKQEISHVKSADSISSIVCLGRNLESQSLEDKLSPLDLAVSNTVITSNVDSSEESEDVDSIKDNKSLSNSNLEMNIGEASSEYSFSPIKKLVVKENDQDPNATNFEWITEMTNDKLEVQDESIPNQNEGCENGTVLETEPNHFLDKAKLVFDDVINN